jgi:DNA processing protein
MYPQALRYSLDDRITLSDIREWKTFDIDTAELSSRMLDNNINSVIERENTFHYKFHLIKSKPYIIYYTWNLSLLDSNILWIVWPRKKTFYSDKVLSKLLEIASNYNLVTISGMAEWVDLLGHSLSIKNNIPTIAVLGWWLRRYLNKSERNIISSIVEHGWLVISEFKLNFQPTNYSFPQRNRIIAGLSDVLFLPQAWLNSGSLITVDFAIDMSRPVYWVADNIFAAESAWLNQYIADKKINLVSNFDKFLSSHFDPKSSSSKLSTSNIILSENEKKILTIISDNLEIWLDKLCTISDIPSQELFSLLTMLEINNLIYQSSPGIYKTI